MLACLILENFPPVEKIRCKNLVDIIKWSIFVKSEISLYKNVRFLSVCKPIGRACEPES